jgi:hypothetical protein
MPVENFTGIFFGMDAERSVEFQLDSRIQEPE